MTHKEEMIDKLRKIYDTLERRSYDPTINGFISYLIDAIKMSKLLIEKKPKGSTPENYRDDLITQINNHYGFSAIRYMQTTDCKPDNLVRSFHPYGIHIAYK